MKIKKDVPPNHAKKSLFFLFCCYLVLVAGSSYYLYLKNVRATVSEVDGILLTAANSLDEILGVDFHSKYTLKNPMEKIEYRQWVVTLNRLVENLGIEFLYSMALVDGKVYFVVSNETMEDIERETFSIFYNEYPDPPEDLLKVFENQNIKFSSYTNQWGSFRSIFLPRMTPEGLPYVLAADIKAREMDKLLNNSIMMSLLFTGCFLLPIIPAFLVYKKMMQRREDDLHEQLYYDPLTGLPNRNKLIKDLKKVSIEDKSAILLNVDSFMEINTLFGTHTGDELLIEISELLSDQMPEKALLYRMPADEFIIITQGLEADEAIELTQFLLSGFSSSVFQPDGKELSITMTAGISLKSRNVDHLLSSVNIAKTVARRKQRSFFVYTEKLNQESIYEENLAGLKALKIALQNDRIVPFFQPILNNRSGRIERYEALVRMIDKSGNIIPPYEFLPIAKKSKLYAMVTHQVIKKSFQIFSDKPYSVSLNFTTRDLLETDTLNYLIQQMQIFDMKDKVVIELVESEHISKNDEIIETIKSLKENGIKIAIDDFGSGYSNFEYLLRLQADYIKIDGTLTKDILDNSHSRVIVSAISSFARQLNMEIIAEYVSSREILNQIQSMGIDFSQGYCIGKPSPVVIDSVDEYKEASFVQ